MNSIAELTDVLAKSRQLEPVIAATGQVIVDCLKGGGKLLSCGNGGSGADALHLVEELVGRYSAPRRALPAVCLNADATVLTCIGNDFGFEQIFSRQIVALADPDDVLVVFSTSGNSPNVVAAISAAKAAKARIILLGGKDGGRARGQCDFELIVPSVNTARIQEVHTLILHSWLDQVDREFCPPSGQ